MLRIISCAFFLKELFVRANRKCIFTGNYVTRGKIDVKACPTWCLLSLAIMTDVSCKLPYEVLLRSEVCLSFVLSIFS